MKRTLICALASALCFASIADANQILSLGQREAIIAGALDPQGGPVVTIYNTATFPHDWTEGTGTLGATGEIDIPAPPSGKQRRWLYVQNQGTSALPIRYETRRADGVTQSFSTVVLAPAASTGSAGGTEERGFGALIPQGIVKIGNTAISALDNQQITIMEIEE